DGWRGSDPRRRSSRERHSGARLLGVLRRAHGHRARRRRAMSTGIDRESADTLMNDYCERLDGDRLEDWLQLFTDDCSYRTLPRENVDLGMPAPIMLCANKNMLRDRVTALRTANEYNLHYGRHLVSNLRLKPEGEGACRLEASFAVYQTNLEGQ